MNRILIISDDARYTYRFRKEIILALINSHQVFVAVPFDDNISALHDMGCQCLHTDLDRRGSDPAKDIRLLKQYWQIAKHTKPDIILTFATKPNIYGGVIGRFCKVPYLCSITGLGTAMQKKGIMHMFMRMLYRTALKKARMVFFQNQENLDMFMRKRIIKQNHALVPGSGVNIYEYSPIPYEISETVNFLFASRIIQEKGIDIFMDAAETIRAEFARTRFSIIGFCEEEYDRMRMNRLHRTGIIEYHGMQSDVRRFYADAHCVVHPTYYPEGMSNVLLEAAACARPVITTDQNGCREVVDDGVNGFIVQPKNSRELAEKIRMFLALPFAERREMGLAGRRKIEREFDRRLVVEAYAEAIIRETDNRVGKGTYFHQHHKEKREGA